MTVTKRTDEELAAVLVEDDRALQHLVERYWGRTYGLLWRAPPAACSLTEIRGYSCGYKPRAETTFV